MYRCCYTIATTPPPSPLQCTYLYISDYQGSFFDDFSNTSVIKLPNITRRNFTLNVSPKSDSFNSSDVVMKLFVSGIDQAVRSAYNSSIVSCIHQQASSLFNQNAVAAIAMDIASLRNATSSFYFIDQFVQNLTLNILSMSVPSDDCVKNLLKLTCSKCQKAIPKLCTNVCAAVAKGCFSPYYAALNPQFNIMWNVTAQLVDFINMTLTDLFYQQTKVLNITQFVCALLFSCVHLIDMLLFHLYRSPM